MACPSLTLISVPVYPSNIGEVGLDNAGKLANADACGLGVSFVCGCAVSVEIGIRDERIAAVGFTTNGCGYMAACAQTLASAINGVQLAELHGLDDEPLNSLVHDKLGDMPKDRGHCISATLEALHGAFADLRRQRVESYEGDAALICSCFGVTEETIHSCIAAGGVSTVDDVTERCRAGGGCGSCRILIQEMIDIEAKSDPTAVI